MIWIICTVPGFRPLSGAQAAVFGIPVGAHGLHVFWPDLPRPGSRQCWNHRFSWRSRRHGSTRFATEENQRKRYRNALADLAHSLKNPLAVIQSQHDISTNASDQLQRINLIIEHQLKRAQSAGQSSWYLGVPVKQVVSKLVATLAKIYQDNELSFVMDIDEKASFKGDDWV